MLIGIVTPSYLREKVLRRFLRRMSLQTYRDWKLVVVHDGPNPAIEAIVGEARARDPRFAYTHTERRSNNYGASPRAEGLRFLIREVSPDYCVFWDDDNYFWKGALRRIAAAIEQAGRPDLLLVPIRYDHRILPPPGVTPDQISWGQVDTGCLVARPRIALESYEDMLENFANQADPKFFYTQDARCFLYIRDQVPGVKIGMASMRPIGVHNGLIPSVFVRSLLGIPPLGLLRS